MQHLKTEEPSEDLSWGCPRCTFRNHALLKCCEICEYIPNGDHAVGIPSYSKAKTPEQVIELFDEDNEDTEHLSSSSPTSAMMMNNETTKRRRAATSMKAEERSRLIKARYQEPRPDPNLLPEATAGILELVKIVMDLQQLRYSVASPSCMHYSQAGRYGAQWSCGYRNIQMLCSCLMGIPAFKSRLFAGDGIVPPIYHLQKYIEQAWKAGFDPEGAAHFKNKLVGSSKYIGTTECAALLRFFKIRAIIVDFPAGGMSPTDLTGIQREEQEDILMGQRLFAWLQKYFEHQWSGDDQSFKSCLYFQHDGHSRTISGVKWGKEGDPIDNVMIFDPSLNAKSMKHNLLDGNMIWQRQLFREQKCFKKTEYQILFVAPGIMDDEEWERSKLLVGASEYSNIAKEL